MAKKNGKTNGHGMKLYTSYMFRDKDPVIDEVRAFATDSRGRINRKLLRQVENGGGPTVSCTLGWFVGKTRKPNSCSIEAFGRELGHRRVWVKHTAK